MGVVGRKWEKDQFRESEFLYDASTDRREDLYYSECNFTCNGCIWEKLFEEGDKDGVKELHTLSVRFVVHA